MDRVERIWWRSLDAHLRSAHAHEVAADISARMRDRTRAAVESELATVARTAYAERLERHPEWARGTAGRWIVDGAAVNTCDL
jgi:hypothetical protein